MTNDWRAQLEPWLRSRLDAADVVVASVAPFGDGHSGFTYVVELSGGPTGEFVLRLSPPGARISANADVGRQGRIMAALHAVGLPTPRVLVADSSGDMAGRAAMLTERIDGADWATAAQQHSDQWVSAAAIAFLHRLRDVPAEQVLPGEPALSNLDELRRWATLLERTSTGPWTAGRRLLAALADTLPDPVAPSVVHGDFHYGNILFRPEADASSADGDSAVAAVLDWEIAGVGDARWDLGSLAVATLRRKYIDEPNPTGGLDVSLEDLLAVYGDRPGLSWFVAAACFKYAAILGYNHGLHVRGRRIDPIYDGLLGTIHGLPADGLALLDASA